MTEKKYSNFKSKIAGSKEILFKICFGLIFFTALIIRLQNLSVPLGNELHSFRQTETAIVIRYYLKEGFSFFNYPMPILGEPWSIIFEAPIYQSFVYLFMKILGLTDIDACCKVISIIIFLLSALALFALTKLISDSKTAFITYTIYLFMPYTMYWSRAALVDYLSVLFAIIYSFCLLKWLYNHGSLSYISALLVGTLAYLQKSSTMFAFVFFLSVYIISHWLNEISKSFSPVNLHTFLQYHKSKIGTDILLGIICIVPASIGVLWTKHADTVNSGSKFTYWLTSKELHDWFYGTFSQRLTIDCWRIIFDRLKLFIGSWILFFIVLAIFIIRCKNNKTLKLAKVSGITVFIPIIVLFNLFYVHDYYLICVTPFVAIFLASIYSEVFKIVKINSNEYISSVFISILIIVSFIVNPIYLNGLKNPVFVNNNIGLYVKRISDDNEKLIIEGEDWDPVTPYYAERKALMMRSPDWIQDIKPLLGNGKYQIILGHNLKLENELLKDTKCVMEYVLSPTSTYIYRIADKYNNPVRLPNDMVRCKKEGKKFDITGRSDNLIYIKYPDIEQSYPIKICSSTKQGNNIKIKEGIIGLLSEQDGLMIDLDYFSQDADEIWFEGLRSGNISVMIKKNQ